MEPEMKHDHHDHEHHHHGPWQSNWKSPVALGIFLVTAALALTITLYGLLNVVGAVIGALQPQQGMQGISAQQLQQLQAQQGASVGQ